MRVPSRSPGQQPGSPASPTAPARRRPSGATPRRVPAPAPDLPAYRAAVAELLVEVGALADAASTRARQVLIDERLREPALAAVLDATPQGLIGARETLLLEMARYQPTTAPRQPTSARWSGSTCSPASTCCGGRTRRTFVTDDQVNAAPTWSTWSGCAAATCCASATRSSPPRCWAGRARGPRRRLRPDATPRTAGLLFRRARREVVALLNDIGRRVHRRRAGRPPRRCG